MTEQLHPVHQTHDGFFNTSTGRKISIHNPTPDMMDINEIAHALSHICRFGGHSPEHYSVAQHSILVSYLAPMDLAFPALMHDAAEAYCNDITKPWKNFIGNPYVDKEKEFEKLICEKFGINPLHMEMVKQWDKNALEIEHGYFWKGDLRFERVFGTEQPYWTHAIAKEMFLDKFHQLKF